MTDQGTQSQGGTITHKRLSDCLKSATIWEEELPRYANWNQTWADRFSIAAGILSAVTGLSVWSVLSKDPWWVWQVMVAVFSVAASVCALLPRVKNWAEQAGLARELASQYGRLIGDLVDLTHQPMDQTRAQRVIGDFQVTKEKKDSLRGLRNRDVIEIEQARMRAKAVAAEARLKAAEARLKIGHEVTGPNPEPATAREGAASEAEPIIPVEFDRDGPPE